MKFYKNELDLSNKSSKIDEKVLEELFQDIRKRINGLLAVLEELKRHKLHRVYFNTTFITNNR